MTEKKEDLDVIFLELASVLDLARLLSSSTDPVPLLLFYSKKREAHIIGTFVKTLEVSQADVFAFVELNDFSEDYRFLVYNVDETSESCRFVSNVAFLGKSLFPIARLRAEPSWFKPEQ